VGNFWDWNLHGEIGAHRYKVGWEIDWQKLLPRRGFEVLPRRWVVERTFSWLSQNRRMSKDYERLCATAEAFVYVAMTRLMVRRLARV
jgi:putative transposase